MLSFQQITNTNKFFNFKYEKIKRKKNSIDEIRKNLNLMCNVGKHFTILTKNT